MGAGKKKRSTSKRAATNGRPAAKRREPFANAKPIDLDRFIGALPDDRPAEEILADLYAMKYGRPRLFPDLETCDIWARISADCHRRGRPRQH